MEKCDCCKAEMKYPRLSKTGLYACEDCRTVAYAKLGKEVSAVHISLKK